VVESDGLENRCAGNGTVGSNPTLSAIIFSNVKSPAFSGALPFEVGLIAEDL
jgi:hypothetical protein